MSTFFGLLPIAFSNFEYFRKYFFVQYVVILVVGLWNGLVFLPVLLSFFGPSKVELTEHETIDVAPKTQYRETA